MHDMGRYITIPLFFSRGGIPIWARFTMHRPKMDDGERGGKERAERKRGDEVQGVQRSRREKHRRGKGRKGKAKRRRGDRVQGVPRSRREDPRR